MPRSIKKNTDGISEGKYFKVSSVGMKTSSTSNRQKKIKTAFNNYNFEKSSSAYSSVNKLKNSESSDSVIYVGSYKFTERCPIIDLTNSSGSMKSGESLYPIRRYPNLLKCHTVYKSMTSLVRSQSLTCTASTSQLMDSFDEKKVKLSRSSKSSSCLVVVNDNKHIEKFRTIDVLGDAHLLSSKEKAYINRITQLSKKDHDIINDSLNIADDVRILENCAPKVIIGENVPIQTLMKAYNVDSSDEFV